MLDIEYAHAMAPEAPVYIYLSDPTTFSGDVIEATVDALNTAVNNNTCSALSISIESCGFPTTYYTGALHTTYEKAATQGQTVIIAEGDQGAAEYDVDTNTNTCVVGTTQNVNELASDPTVTSIGGTQFTPNYKNGNDVGSVPESVWNEGTTDGGQIGAGGGGKSIVWSKPAFQDTGTPDDEARDVPDISMEAACHTPGVFSVFPVAKHRRLLLRMRDQPRRANLGGNHGATGSEQRWQSRRSTEHPLYVLGNEHNTAATGIRNVTSGNNDFNGVTGFNAETGFNLATGWGTPDIATFVPAFLGQPVPTPSPSGTPTRTATPTATPTPGVAKLTVSKSIKFGKTTEVNATSKPKDATVKNASSKKDGASVTMDPRPAAIRSSWLLSSVPPRLWRRARAAKSVSPSSRPAPRPKPAN